MSAFSAIAAVLAALVSACHTTSDAQTGPELGASAAGRPVAEPVVTDASADPLETIARLESARSDGDGVLESLAAEGEELARIHAVQALGRLPFPEYDDRVTQAIAAAIADADPRVRAAAAFALGVRGDASAAQALLDRSSDAVATVRARVVEAASRLDDPRLRELVLAASKDKDVEVRRAAAIGPHRWPATAPDAAAVDAALVAVVEGGEEEVAWGALFSLARRKSASARAVFVKALASDEPRARIFAAQGLRTLAPDRSSREALIAATADADWRVVCEAALALGEHPNAAAVPALVAAAEHPSAHVRRCAAESLGRFSESANEARSALERLRLDESPNVRAAALVSQARLFKKAVAGEIQALADREDARLRAGAAAAAALLPNEQAVPLLVRLSRDRDRRVADIAARGLKEHPTPEARARIAALLEDADNGLRLAAAETLKDIGTSDDLERLERCLSSSQGDIAAEIAANVVDAAARIGGDRARVILEVGASHPDPYVRRKARALLAAASNGTAVPASAQAAARPPARRGEVVVPGRDFAAGGPNPRVEIVTNRGTMTFELFPEETPTHVLNFLELARSGFYDGLTFHRVVPDFVIQGGDPRGDGNGSKTWQGAPLLAEFTPREFGRGALGMPRNDDPDSGGCQVFVTHRETPHLDGRYTLFGELREGFEVLDAIEVGDTIKSVRLLPEGATR